MSPVTCHLSPTPTAIAKDPPPANYPTMHSRLICQDRTQEPIFFFIQTFFLRLHVGSGRRRRGKTTNAKQTDGHWTYRLNRPSGLFSWGKKKTNEKEEEKSVTCNLSHVTCIQHQPPQPQFLPLITHPLCTVSWFAKTEMLS